MGFLFSLIVIIILLFMITLQFYIKNKYRKIWFIKIYKNNKNAKSLLIGIISGITGAAIMGYKPNETLYLFLMISIFLLMFTPSLK